LSCTYLAHHELESVLIIIIIQTERVKWREANKNAVLLCKAIVLTCRTSAHHSWQS